VLKPARISLSLFPLAGFSGPGKGPDSETQRAAESRAPAPLPPVERRKGPIQALNRTAPLLPLRLGIPAQMIHDYQRHGTTSLFAALEVTSGKVHGRCYRGHWHQEFVAFLNSLARRYLRRETHGDL